MLSILAFQVILEIVRFKATTNYPRLHSPRSRSYPFDKLFDTALIRYDRPVHSMGFPDYNNA